MSTLTKYSAIPYTGPAPTNREAYVPADVATNDTRGAELASQLANVEQERGQDLPTLVVDKNDILNVPSSLKAAGHTLPLDLGGNDCPRREKRFDVMYQLYSLDKNERVRIKVPLGEHETIPTSTGLFKAYDWFE